MPKENGLQLAEKVHREMPECKVLMLTAYLSNAMEVELHLEQTKQPLKLLNKPCQPELLLKEAEELLRTA